MKLSDSERNNSKYNFEGPVEEIKVTQEMRQEMFDRQETTDDHGMVIVGKAVDQKGNRYYKVKNSWDTNNIYDGFFYVSEPYFLAKTLDIYLNKEAVPQAILNKLNVKKGDTVRIITGKDRGKEGKVRRTIPETERVVVEKLNLMKKAMRPTQQNPQGGISTMEAPLHASNVMLVCPSCKAATRVGHRINDAGKKVRVCKKCGKDID